MKDTHFLFDDNIEVLTNSLGISAANNLKFSVDKCSWNKRFCVISVSSENVEKEYVLVKIPKLLDTFSVEKHANNSKVLRPVFTMQNKKKEIFAAFENPLLINFVEPKRNNNDQLKTMLETLAEYQAKALASSDKDEETLQDVEYSINDEAKVVTSLEFSQNLDQANVSKQINKLEVAVKKMLKSKLVLKSVASFSNHNVLVRSTNDCVFLDINTAKIAPPVYDALVLIFSNSDSKFRQRYFQELKDFYFLALAESLKKLDSNIVLTSAENENALRVFLPVVKFELAVYLSELRDCPDTKLQLEEILTNISYFLKYPLINEEDCYEVVRNKLDCTECDFLSFEMIPLEEKNGHLGQYFKLIIKVNHQREVKDIQVFAKFIIPETEFMTEIVMGLPSKKEDFFYQTLYPIFAEHGLRELLDFAPICYLVRPRYLLVLEDMSIKGFVGLRPSTVLDFDALSLVVTQMAKLHSCTMIFEEILSQKEGKIVRMDEKYPGFFEESVLVYDDGNYLKKIFDLTLECIHYFVQKFPELTIGISSEEITRKINETFWDLFNKASKSDKFRNTICHGDMYVANMLLKFDETHAAIDGCLVDFQMLRYCPPSHDLLFFLYLNSSKETREKHLPELLDQYYQQVTGYIEKFGLDPKTVYPRNDYESSLKYMKSQAVYMSLQCGHVLMAPPEMHDDIFYDQEKTNYYLFEHRKEFVDLGLDFETYRSAMRGLTEDLMDVLQNYDK